MMNSKKRDLDLESTSLISHTKASHQIISKKENYQKLIWMLLRP